MALSDNLLTEKESLTALLETEYNQQNLRGELLQRLFFVRFLLGELVGSGGGGAGDASAANQTIVQANAGSDASKALSVQGITNGKPIPVSFVSAPNVNASQSGTWTVDIGASDLALESGGNLASLASNLSTVLSTKDTTAPSKTVSVAGIDGGILRPISVDSAGRIKISPTGRQSDAISISVCLADTDYFAVGSPASTPPISDTGTANINGRLQRISQRLTSLIDLFPVSIGAKTAAGSLSVVPATNTTFTVTGSVAAGSTDSGNPIKFGGVFNTTRPTYTNGQRGDLQISARGGLIADYEDYTSTPNNINTVDVASSTVAGADGQNIITGNATNNSTVTALISGNSSFAFLITGTWVGTLQFERSLDGGTTWTSIGAFAAGTNFIGQTTTSNGAFHGNASSSNGLRVRAITWTSGVANIRILAGQGTGTITVGNPLRIMDGTSGAQATIKAASTAPLATDTAVVVSTRDFAATSTISNIASSTTSGVLVAANNNRRLVVINNDSTATLYIVLNASVASTTNYTTVLEPRQTGRAPSSVTFTGKEYSGEIRGIWDSANGFARITETV